jgi:crotonobetainyl-CoA:carnitine CoA-transferase CaiB-like acyl-CoA transferase
LSVTNQLDTQPSDGPLSGLRVVDLTIWMAGSIAGMLLADLGADVVKVESRAGDPARGHVAPTAGASPVDQTSSTSLSFTACNRNKRSIALDLTDEADRAIFEGLLAAADVFVTNLAAPTLRKLGIDEAAVRTAHPGVVYARATGFGTVGPRADDPAQDMTGMAYAGMLFTASPDPDEPFAPPGAMNDVLTGTMVAFGIMAALAERAHSGRGCAVIGSLLQTSLWSQALLLGSVANTTGGVVDGRSRRNPRNAALNQYRASDDKWIGVAAINARAWPAFVAAAGLDDLTADPRFATFDDATEHATQLREILDRHFTTAPAQTWLDRFRAHGVWCGPVNRLADVLVDEHVDAEGYLATLSDGVRTVTMPFTLSDWAVPQVAGPQLDADRAAILRDWGIAG